MASPTSNLLSAVIPDCDIQTCISKEQNADVGNSESSTLRLLTSNHQITNDGTSLSADIPQWKKDLIQRRKTNIAKTIVANQNLSTAANISKATRTNTSTLNALSPSSESKNLQFLANNNNINKLMMRTSNAHTINETMINASQHSLTSTTAVNVNNVLKKPATIKQQDEIKSTCGGHYTQYNIKSSDDSYNYNETVSEIPQEHAPDSVTRSLSIVEQTSNDGSSTLTQDNVRSRKNLTEQHEATNTTSSDSLITSTSRLNRSLKVAATAEIYTKSNKDNFSVCVSEQQTHVLQEPALTTNVSSNTNGSDDDEYQLHHQLKSKHESGSLCASVNVACAKEVDLKLFPINNVNGNISLFPKVVLNEKTCGIANASVRSSSTSQFLKNHSIGNSTLVSSHHNYKINTKYRLNQISTSSLSLSTTSSVIESPTTLTNNKKKMVAVKEMNEISSNELDFDPSEELQYGPGIVSKLRCRYLSLALRQSMGKQLLSMDTLRRATSLNNLLDDNDVHDEDEDGDTMDTRNIEERTPTSLSVPQIELKGIPLKLNEGVVRCKTNVKNFPDERITGTTFAYTKQHRSRHIKRGNDSLKRARSVEALLCEKSPWNFSNSQPTMLTNGIDTVTIEDKINSARDRLLLGTDNPPKRLTSIIDDTERPPPDLVKQTLKIFEASANRRGRVPNRNIGGEVATKVANYKSIITQNKPAIAFPKPPISLKKSHSKKSSVEVKYTPPTTPTESPTMQAEKNLVPLSSTPAASSRTITAFRHKMDYTPIRNSECVSSIDGLSENSPDIIPRHKLLDKALSTIVVADSPVSKLSKKIENFRIESTPMVQTHQQQTPRKEFQSTFSTESSDRESEDNDSIDGEYIINNEECGLSKHISLSALDNIVKAGSSSQFQIQMKSSASLSNGNLLAKLPEPLYDLPTSSTASATTCKQIGVIRPLLTESQHKENKCIIGCSEENISNQTPSTLTRREIEKNRINNERKVETSGTNSSMDKSGCVENTITKVTKNIGHDEAAQAPAWSSAIITKKKRNPVGSVAENNTMVFNFKDRKEVPDYIDNDGLIFKRKRELPKPNESGFVLLGDLSLETSTDPEDEWPICPPSPCDVEFENAHIIIDGKSNIKNRPKEAHLRVQFNDMLTSTFEYPSESSVIEDSGSEYTDLSLNAFDSPSSTLNASMYASANISHEIDSPVIHHHHVTVDEIIQLPQNNKVLGSLSLGSAPLGSYTPVKAKTENIFQLGVTRVPNIQSEKPGDEVQSKEIFPADYCGELDTSLEYLKPASDDLTIAYSEGSLKTDLLY